MRKEIKIGDINFNTSCGSNSSIYPYGLLMFGSYHKTYIDELTKVELIIANDSKEGLILKEMLSNKTDLEVIKKYLFGLIIENITIEELQNLINKRLLESYQNGLNDGKREKIKEIRKALEL